MKNVYVGDAEYKLLAITVARDLPPCRWSGGADLETAKIELAELGVWPQSIAADAEAHGHCEITRSRPFGSLRERGCLGSTSLVTFGLHFLAEIHHDTIHGIRDELNDVTGCSLNVNYL